MYKTKWAECATWKMCNEAPKACNYEKCATRFLSTKTICNLKSSKRQSIPEWRAGGLSQTEVVNSVTALGRKYFLYLSLSQSMFLGASGLPTDRGTKKGSVHRFVSTYFSFLSTVCFIHVTESETQVVTPHAGFHEAPGGSGATGRRIRCKH